MVQIAPSSFARGKPGIGATLAVLVTAVLAFLLVGCGLEGETTTASPVTRPSRTPVPKATPFLTPTAQPQTNTPVPTVTPTLAPTATPTPAPTATPWLNKPLVLLPKDEAPHETPVEWWYLNGFLWDDAGNEYSFHYVTFQSPSLPVGTPHLLHATLADHQRQEHSAEERGTLTTLDPDAPSVDVDAEGWVMRGDGESYELHFDLDGRALSIEATSPLDPVLHNSTGLVDLGEAGETYYYSRTRMRLDGWLEDANGRRAVSGSGWMDHQWGNISRLDVGWDWLNLIMDDGSDLMVAVVWQPGQQERVASYATYVTAGGDVVHVPGDDVDLTATGAWVSPETGIEFPMGWLLEISPLGVDLQLEPVLEQAEFAAGTVLPVVYWEGAVTASGQAAGSHVTGRGFVELVGYDPSQTTAVIPTP